MQQYTSNIIGTHLIISIDSEKDLTRLFSDITFRLQNFEFTFSRFIEDNWLANVNKKRNGILDNDGKYMLESMLKVSQDTQGYFDPTVGKRLSELGYGPTKDIISGESSGYHDYRDIKIDGDRVILEGDIELEFGGAGKGYLIGVLRNMLLNSQIEGFLINFGGDLYGNKEWKVGLESPFSSDEAIGIYILQNTFFACSAGTKRKWGNHHHLINPKTGLSSTEVVASYIEGKSGILVDMYATTLCVMPWNVACTTLEETVDIDGVIIRNDGSIFQSKNSDIQLFEE